MDGVSGLDVLTFVLRVAPAIVPVAAMLLFMVLALRLLAVGRWLRARGAERYALYSDFVIANFGIVGAFVTLGFVKEKLTGAPLSGEFANLRLTGGEASIELIAAVTVGLLFAYYAVAVASGWLSRLFGEKESAFAIAMRPTTAGERFAWVTVMSPTAGFCEELIFRGLLLSVAFTLGADAVIAVALTSLAFGLGHAGYGLSWTMGTTLLGALSAAAVLWSGSLWPAIIAHTLYDMTVYYVFEDAPAEHREGEELPAPAQKVRWLSPLR